MIAGRVVFLVSLVASSLPLACVWYSAPGLYFLAQLAPGKHSCMVAWKHAME